MKQLTYDEEVFPNFFCACFEDCWSSDKFYFEISPWRNDTHKLREFIKDCWLFGYNNMMYDNVIINYIIRVSPSNEMIFRMNQQIINDDYEKISQYKYNDSYLSIDMMRMMFSKMQRVSLKELQVTMNWPNVLECSIPFNSKVKESDISDIKYYCENDVSSTKALVLLKQENIRLRVTIEKQFGLKCLSKDDVRTGVDLFANFYEKDSGSRDFLDKRTPRPVIFLKDCISDKIHFQSKTFQDFLALLKTKMISGTKGAMDYKIIYGNTMFVYGTGGIHSNDTPGIYKPKDDEFYLDIDVTGMYPSIWINSNRVPEHLNANIFIPRYKWLRDTRAANKKTNKMLADTLKLATNGSFGNLINEYSWLYDPLIAMTINKSGGQ